MTTAPLEQTATMSRKHARTKAHLTIVFATVGALGVIGGLLAAIGNQQEANITVSIAIVLLSHAAILSLVSKRKVQAMVSK